MTDTGATESCGAADDLLVRLAPRGDRGERRHLQSPVENFVTEALYWLLERSDFGARFLDELKKHGTKPIPVVGTGYHWSTQRTYLLDKQLHRPDMVCTSADGKTAFIFEHKVDAPIDNKQLARYRRIGDQEFGRCHHALILVTACRWTPVREVDRHVSWCDVHGWLVDWLDSGVADDATAFVARCFLVLLKWKRLGPQSDLRPMKELVEQVAQRAIWLELNEGKPPELNKDWGREDRFGLHLRCEPKPATWKPGLFAGILASPTNHGPSSAGSWPAACVTLDMHKDWHCLYRSGQSEPSRARDCYRCMAAAMQRVGADNGWMSHNRPQSGRHGGDWWHPVVLYKPMAEVLAAASSSGDQAMAFADDVARVAKAVLDLPEFAALRRSLTRSS